MHTLEKNKNKEVNIMRKTLKIILPMLILIIAISVCSFNSFSVFAESDIKLCVYGEATTQAKTDSITVYLNVQNCSNNLEDAQNLTLTQFENAVKNLSDYTLTVDCYYSDFSSLWRNEQQHCSSINFSSKFESFDQVKSFIEKAMGQENVTVKTVCFNTTNITDTYNTALTQAIENAKQKVSSIVTDKNLEIKKVCEQQTYLGSVCKDFVTLTELENVETIDVTAKVKVFFE